MEGKYVLVISQESEKSTDQVLKYLHYFGEKFVRINDTDVAEHVSITLGDTESVLLSFKGGTVILDDVKSVWYRRGRINVMSNYVNDKLTTNEQAIYKQYMEFYNRELDVLLDYIYYSLKQVKYINNFKENSLGKLHQLSVARKSGLKIPKTILNNAVDEIGKNARDKTLILKALSFPLFTVQHKGHKTKYEANYSMLMDYQTFEAIEKNYPNNKSLISFFQAYIEKKLEIRAFYLYGRIYSMAIFSQQNEKTRIDFRNYDHDRPNRNVPFKLPQHIEEKIRVLMAELALNCGSLDLIYTHSKEYYFLEVNPIGQYDWLAHACNYNIDKQIAKELINGTERPA